jgi:hypothetical protein
MAREPEELVEMRRVLDAQLAAFRLAARRFIWVMRTCNPVRLTRRRGWSAMRPGLLRRPVRHGW